MKYNNIYIENCCKNMNLSILEKILSILKVNYEIGFTNKNLSNVKTITYINLHYKNFMDSYIAIIITDPPEDLIEQIIKIYNLRSFI